MSKPRRRSPFAPVIKGARKALQDILELGLPRDIAEGTVGRIFSNPMKDAMEIQEKEPVETKKKARRKRSVEGE